MKKSILILVLCILQQIIFSQSKWSFGLSFQPGTSGLYNPKQYIFNNTDTNNVYQGNKYSFILTELVEFRLNKRIHLRSGISFSKMGFIWQQKREFYTEEFLQSILYAFPQLVNWERTTSKNNYYFVGIPLIFNYDIKTSGNLYFSLNSGILFNYFFGNKEFGHLEFTNKFENLESQETGQDLRFHYFLQFGVSINYTLTNNVKIFMEPNFAYDFTKLDKPETEALPFFDGNFWHIGINFGIMYNLK
jgi:hypothetical protein